MEWISYAIVYFYNAYGDKEISQGRYSTLIAKYKNVCDGAKALPVVARQQMHFTHVDDIISVLDFTEKVKVMILALEQMSYSILDVVKMFGKEIEWLPERRNRFTAALKTNKRIAGDLYIH